jgi:hypothetical protein
MHVGTQVAFIVVVLNHLGALAAPASCGEPGPAPKLETASSDYKAIAARYRSAEAMVAERTKELPDDRSARFNVNTETLTRITQLPQAQYNDWRNTESKIRHACALLREAEIDAAVRDTRLLATEISRLKKAAEQAEQRAALPKAAFAQAYSRDTDRLRQESSALETRLAQMKRDLSAARRDLESRGIGTSDLK